MDLTEEQKGMIDSYLNKRFKYKEEDETERYLKNELFLFVGFMNDENAESPRNEEVNERHKYLIKWRTMECEDEDHYYEYHTVIKNFTDEELCSFIENKRKVKVTLIK